MTSERIDLVGAQCAPLLRFDSSWIERRKESIEVLDDTALRRQISVDFRLLGNAQPVLPASGSEPALWSAPVFALAKSPADLMAFDLTDECGKSLRLVGRTDNARVSGACLVHMASDILDAPVSPQLKTELRNVAEREPGVAGALCRRLTGEPGDATRAALAADARFVWWARLLAHSSLVIVLYRAAAPGRKLVKLSFEEPIANKLSRKALLGWDPYRVWIDSPLVEARSYHFEATAPTGMRITEAAQGSDHLPDEARNSGSLRKVHLYRPGAATAGSGTVALKLRVAAGSEWGGLVAAFGTFAALLACWIRAEEIAISPSSPPALLLLFPGLIATFVARPDRHALTARLLAGARWLLAACAGLAYLGAARIALGGGAITQPDVIASRTDSLRTWFAALTLAAAVPLGALVVGWLRQRGARPPWAPTVAEAEDHTTRTPAEIVSDIRDPQGPVASAGYELDDVQDDAGRCLTTATCSRWYGTWVLQIAVSEAPVGTYLVRCTSELVSKMGRPFVARPTRRELSRVEELMLTLTDPR